MVDTSSPGSSRRVLLKRGLFGGLVLAVGGAGFLSSRGGRSEPLPVGGLKVVSASQYAVLAALCRRFVPARPGFPSVDELGTAVACDGILAQVDATALAELQQLLGLFDNALVGLLFGGRPTPFTALGAEAQDEVLAAWQTSRLAVRRTGFHALRGLVMAAYYGNPKTWGAVGYPGPPPGLTLPDAPEWKGGGVPRPPGFGVWQESP